ncbi:hypothetical protein [Demequina litorisediminis]|uniref:Orn/DAP/Arg decarboxylase 2 N-terminal domain-containing protein n=1 Tax=Demequina litorisediminis TaxID=1849022 RepID=A0ABQ6IGJ6_9MICO|nr:hypothetical protein [Demequina litorisediminis]GMA36905.1 hypothetical protein GCM10025876_31090 [Demequina litorisediminis]
MAEVHGVSPLTGRTEPWMEDLLADADACAALVAEYGSPVNVLDFGPLTRNTSELVDAAASEGVRLGVFVARKANKALGLVHAAREAGLGVDVASLAEPCPKPRRGDAGRAGHRHCRREVPGAPRGRRPRRGDREPRQRG